MKIWHYSVRGKEEQTIEIGKDIDDLLEEMIGDEQQVFEIGDEINSCTVFKQKNGFWVAKCLLESIEELVVIEDFPSLLEFLTAQSKLFQALYETALSRSALLEDD